MSFCSTNPLLGFSPENQRLWLAVAPTLRKQLPAVALEDLELVIVAAGRFFALETAVYRVRTGLHQGVLPALEAEAQRALIVAVQAAARVGLMPAPSAERDSVINATEAARLAWMFGIQRGPDGYFR